MNIKTNIMTVKEILETRNERGIISLANDSAGWSAISRDGCHLIYFDHLDVNRFYKNEKSFAKRVSQLLKRGF